MPYHVSKQTFGRLVEEALAGLPEPFASHLEEISVEVRDRPTKKQLKQLGLDDDELLLGLYVGRAITRRSVEDSGTLPDVIYIFQEDVVSRGQLTGLYTLRPSVFSLCLLMRGAISW